MCSTSASWPGRPTPAARRRKCCSSQAAWARCSTPCPTRTTTPSPRSASTPRCRCRANAPNGCTCRRRRSAGPPGCWTNTRRKDQQEREMPTTPIYDVILRGGRVIDPARGVDALQDVAVRAGKIAKIAPKIAGRAKKTIAVKNRLVIPGMIDTHGHIYQYVTGTFGMNPDLVGIRSGVTAVVDQGGAAPLTIQGFRKFIAEPAATRVYSFISNYLVGGLAGHLHVGLYGPHGINVRETVKAIQQNRDLVKGIKCHAEPGGYSRWGIETLKLAKQASREARVPVYIHLGRLWMEADGSKLDPDAVMADVVPLLDAGDILAHPFTKHAGAFVSREGKVHPLVFEAMQRGVRSEERRVG